LFAGLGALALGTALLAGCADEPTGDVPGKIDIVASTDVWGSVAAAVGGSRVAVLSLIGDSSQDPHSFQAGSRTLLAVRDADLVIENGGGYDDFMSSLVASSHTDAPVVDAVAVSGRTAPADGELNEHVWYDLPTVAKVADTIARRLAELAPRHAGEFEANARTFDRGIDHLRGIAQQTRAEADGAGVGITEPVPAYLLQAMGLHNLTPVEFSRSVEDSGDVAPRALAETLALYTDHRVALLVYNAQTSGPVTSWVEDAARSAGVPVVGVTETLPAGTSYLDWMRHTITRITDALARS
jgi:zinc/manganese transport system substrate-binding protein